MLNVEKGRLSTMVQVLFRGSLGIKGVVLETVLKEEGEGGAIFGEDGADFLQRILSLVRLVCLRLRVNQVELLFHMR